MAETVAESSSRQRSVFALFEPRPEKRQLIEKQIALPRVELHPCIDHPVVHRTSVGTLQPTRKCTSCQGMSQKGATQVGRGNSYFLHGELIGRLCVVAGRALRARKIIHVQPSPSWAPRVSLVDTIARLLRRRCRRIGRVAAGKLLAADSISATVCLRVPGPGWVFAGPVAGALAGKRSDLDLRP
jgi:hypothetical protein